MWGRFQLCDSFPRTLLPRLWKAELPTSELTTQCSNLNKTQRWIRKRRQLHTTCGSNETLRPCSMSLKISAQGCALGALWGPLHSSPSSEQIHRANLLDVPCSNRDTAVLCIVGTRCHRERCYRQLSERPVCSRVSSPRGQRIIFLFPCASCLKSSSVVGCQASWGSELHFNIITEAVKTPIRQ